MSEPASIESSPAATPELADRLRAIEELPLAARAEALGHVYDELRSALEAEDSAARA